MRLSDCPHAIESRAFRESAHPEWMTCLSCGARWSRTTGPDDIQMREGLDMIQPRSTLPCPGCGKTIRCQQTFRREGVVLSAAVNFSSAEESCAYHLLQHHLFHCLCPRVQRHKLQRFRRHKWASNQSARRTVSACGKIQPTHKKTTIS